VRFAQKEEQLFIRLEGPTAALVADNAYED
jgi:hypothetical protein